MDFTGEAIPGDREMGANLRTLTGNSSVSDSPTLDLSTSSSANDIGHRQESESAPRRVSLTCGRDS